MGRRRWFGRDRPAVAPELRRAGEAFASTLASVEGAKAALVTAVRSGRAPGAPLAEALAGFELGLADASVSMDAWRVPDLGTAWHACSAGLDGARVRAEELRLRGDPPRVYEELVAALEELMDPLEPFEGAAERFRALGVRVSP